MIKKYVKRPVIVEAVQVTAGNMQEIKDFVNGKDSVAECLFFAGREDMPVYLIHTLEGVMRAFVGDWIIKGIKGEFYPCKPDIFEATYNEVVPERKMPNEK